MATVHPVSPKNGARAFRDGCKVHWQMRPNPREAALGARKVTYCRQGAARAERDRVAAELSRTGRARNLNDPTTLAEFAARWLKAKRDSDLARNTAASYARNLSVHIVPRLGSRRIASVTHRDILAFARELSADPRISPAYAAQILQNLRQVFDMWMREDGAVTGGRNPVEPGMARRGPPKKKDPPPRPAEIDAIRAQVPEDMRAMLDLFTYSGGRDCEIVAVREEDLVFTRDPAAPLAPQLAAAAAEGREVALHFQGKLEDNGDWTPVMKTLRTNRVIPLDTWIAESLAAHLGKWPPRDGWLFYNIRLPYGQERPDGPDTAERRARVAELWQQGLSRRLIGAELGISASTIQRDLTHIPASDADRGYSTGADGKRHPRRRAGRAVAARGVKRATDNDALRLWHPWSVRRHLHLAADRAGVSLPAGKVTHVFRYYRINALLDGGMDWRDVARWVGDSPATILRNYVTASKDSDDRVVAAIRREREETGSNRRLRLA